MTKTSATAALVTELLVDLPSVHAVSPVVEQEDAYQHQKKHAKKTTGKQGAAGPAGKSRSTFAKQYDYVRKNKVSENSPPPADRSKNSTAFNHKSGAQYVTDDFLQA